MLNSREERVERETGSAVVGRGDVDDPITILQKGAAHLQHKINNPLAALLAEGQLLCMDPGLRGEHRESVDRMIELTRRVITLVRDLDDIRGPHSPR
ncbi:MAG TPA: histidine kinase dimerization/phospho-acceptor domain-containing protein [Gemmatimonadaceae bacterium]|nr:histidine kinase dimerization/phospho-acceptor domain-containing protein [Gemmatimonadaceae bacterium]